MNSLATKISNKIFVCKFSKNVKSKLYHIENSKTIEDKQCRSGWGGSLWATSSRATLFANSAIFVSGTSRVNKNVFPNISDNYHDSYNVTLWKHPRGSMLSQRHELFLLSGVSLALFNDASNWLKQLLMCWDTWKRVLERLGGFSLFTGYELFCQFFLPAETVVIIGFHRNCLWSVASYRDCWWSVCHTWFLPKLSVISCFLLRLLYMVNGFQLSLSKWICFLPRLCRKHSYGDSLGRRLFSADSTLPRKQEIMDSLTGSHAHKILALYRNILKYLI